MANAALPSADDLQPARVLSAYGAGVWAFGHLAAKTMDWAVPTPCAGWTLLELAGHALCKARSYHRQLNTAVEGRPLDRLPRGARLASANAADLAALGPMPGPERLLAFDAVAGRYGERLAEVDWTMTVGSWDEIGRQSVGEHALAAVAEWHLHAWDVARAYGWPYRPDDPEVVAAGCRRSPGWAQTGDPWDMALAAAGRGAG